MWRDRERRKLDPGLFIFSVRTGGYLAVPMALRSALRTIGPRQLGEMLVSCVVFSILDGLLLQAFNSISATSNLSQSRAEILRQAIGALERVNDDLTALVQTGEWKMLVIKGSDASGKNDALIFLGPVSAPVQPAGPRNLSLVRYGIDERSPGAPSFGGWPSMPAFSRTVKPFAWSDDLGSLLPITEASAASALGSAAPQQIAPGVIRYEICFQLWDGTIAAEEPSDKTSIRAIICGIVVVDKDAISQLPGAQRESLAAQFPKVAPHQRPLEAWQGVIEKLPSSVRKTIRIYEQTISI